MQVDNKKSRVPDLGVPNFLFCSSGFFFASCLGSKKLRMKKLDLLFQECQIQPPSFLI